MVEHLKTLSVLGKTRENLGFLYFIKYGFICGLIVPYVIKIIQNFLKEDAHREMRESGEDELYHLPCVDNVCPHYVFQSEEETVKFEDTIEAPSYSFPPSSKDFATDTSTQEMGDFLKRPTLIKTIAWNPAGVTDADWDPWTLYFSNAAIQKKIDNFAYFRGNLHLKVVVNASPFYYGAMLMNYTPTPSYLQPIDNAHVTALVPQSQKPHIWIDLRTNMGGELTLPFIWPYNYCKLTSAASVAILGRMRNITYYQLASANGASTNGVTIQVYAWMEDLELCGNTVRLALQAKTGVVKDEYGTGPISKPATALANWASYLTNVPVIGTYAKATQIGASAVSSVAGLFGWSKVPVIEDVKPVKPLFFHELASAHLSQPTSKVTLDPKAELSVDPRIVGPSNGEDELSISNIVQKDSFLFQTTWATNMAPDSLIANIHVTPGLMQIGSPTSTVYTLGFTPMAYLAEMFANWRGDIIFTFKIICSQYHRGRLRVHWDPVGSWYTIDVSNRNLTKIIDIGETTEVEFRVPYLQYAMWLKTPDLVSNNYSTSVDTGFADGYHNGDLTIRVLNNLSAPIDTASVSFMCFVRGAENLEFANPRSLNNKIQPYVVQALVEDVAPDTQQKSTPLDSRYLINYGEAVPSLRLLLQRAYLSQKLSLRRMDGQDPTAPLQRLSVKMSRMPVAPGYCAHATTKAKGVITTGTEYRYAFTNHTAITWLTPMYVARRGSIQWHFHLADQAEMFKSFEVCRNVDTISASSYALTGQATTIVANADTDSLNVTAKNLLIGSSETGHGVVITDNKVCPSVAVEMPMMTQSRYQITKPDRAIIGYSEDGSDLDTYDVAVYAKHTTATCSTAYISKFVNAGADFSLVFFICAPQLYYCATAGETVL